MRKFWTVLLVILTGGVLAACGGDPKPEPVTTVYLVRHAEKQTGDNPMLTEAGTARAEKLATLLKDENVVQVWSTDTLRTVETADPTAKAFGLDIELYEPMHRYRMVDRFKAQEGVILVVGHSNTIPDMAAAIQDVEASFMDFDESDYESLYWADIMPDGEVLVEKASYADLAKRLK